MPLESFAPQKTRLQHNNTNTCGICPLKIAPCCSLSVLVYTRYQSALNNSAPSCSLVFSVQALSEVKKCTVVVCVKDICIRRYTEVRCDRVKASLCVLCVCE
jgi:hypothetical protein